MDLRYDLAKPFSVHDWLGSYLSSEKDVFIQICSLQKAFLLEAHEG